MVPAETITEPCRIAILAELDRREWGQADLARYIGMTEKHVSQVLTGKVKGHAGLALMLYVLAVLDGEEA